MPFQSQVGQYPAPGVEGDFASLNPIASQLAGPGSFTAGASGLTIARFCWIDPDGDTLSNSTAGSGVPAGFVHRELQALITQWLGEASMVVPEGMPVTAYTAGDFWMRAPAGATRGQAAFAKLTDGTLVVGTAGEEIAGAVETPFEIGLTCAAGELTKISTWSRGA